MDLRIQHLENQTPKRDLHALVETGDPTLQFSSAMFWSTSLLSSPIFNRQNYLDSLVCHLGVPLFCIAKLKYVSNYIFFVLFSTSNDF